MVIVICGTDDSFNQKLKVMNKALIKCAGLALFSFISTATVHAQDVHYVQFDATPLAVNPAFTGMFDGSIRASSLYRNHWSNVHLPYVTYGTSFEMPVFIDKKGNYLAAGVQFFQDLAGDGNLRNQSALASAAYHKHFGKRENHGCDIGIGAQGLFVYRSVNVTSLFYGEQLYMANSNGQFVLGLSNRYSYAGLNIGICFAQSLGSRFNYTIGYSENNINEPAENSKKIRALDMGIIRNRVGVIGVNWILNRWAFRPSFYFITREKLTAFIAGSEFSYILKKPQQNKVPTSVFIGGWYRRGEIGSLTAGVEFKRIRIGVGCDYNFTVLKNSAVGEGGLEVSLKYIAPTKMLFSRKRGFPG